MDGHNVIAQRHGKAQALSLRQRFGALDVAVATGEGIGGKEVFASQYDPASNQS
jgi:hypothetical protein